MNTIRFQYFKWTCGLLLASIFFTSCKKGEEEKEAVESSFRSEVAATEVKVATISRKNFDYLINATGKVDALQEVTVVIERGGFIEEMRIKEGELVSKGKLLAQLASNEAELKLEKAKIALRNAEAAYQSEILSFERIINGEDEERKQAVQEQLKAKTGLLAAQLDLKEANFELQKCKIIAPIDGKIANVRVKQGAVVNAGSEFLQIVNPYRLELKVKVLESDIRQIRLGQEADIIPLGMEGTIRGSVHTINPKVDENGLVQVGIMISQAQSLLPGMNARAVIKIPVSNSLVVPKQALVYRSGKAVVFTVKNNESVWNYVEVGKDNGQEVEIFSGLTEGDQVILTNNLQLAHQAPIQIVKE